MEFVCREWNLYAVSVPVICAVSILGICAVTLVGHRIMQYVPRYSILLQLVINIHNAMKYTTKY